MENYLSPGIAIRQGDGTGRAAFAERLLVGGTVVATFGGRACTGTELARFSPERVSRSLQVDDDLFFVGPADAEPGDFFNHSCQPNCGMRNATQVVTMREIAPGEELTFDYVMTDTAPYDEFTCKCGVTQCRGFVRSGDWKRDDLRKRYEGWFAPHVTRRIAAAARARPLSKAEVERLMNDFDADPVAALTHALRVVTGRDHSSWETLVRLLADSASLAKNEMRSLDRLAAEMNETRTVRLHKRIGDSRNHA